MKKKFFSFLLVAAGLLCSGSAFALINDEASLLAAIDNAGNGATPTVITLDADIPMTKTIAIWEKNIKLDLNGHNLTNGTYACIILYKGKLELVSSNGIGKVENTRTDMFGTTVKDGVNVVTLNDTKRVYGSGIKVNGSSDRANCGDYSHLIIGKNVKVIGSVRGIEIDKVDGSKKDHSVGYVDESIITNAKGTGTAICAGVNVDIYGYVQGRVYGVQVSGNVKDSPSSPTDPQMATYPHINIYGSVSCQGERMLRGSKWDYATGVYASGWAIWYISGSVDGNNGVYVRSGQVTLNDAEITAVGEFYEDAGIKVDPNTGKQQTSGSSGGGNAIAIETSAGNYAGEMFITINGDTKVSSENGYAVIEEITKPDSESKLEGLVINSGTFEAPDGQTIIVTSGVKTEDKVVVVGGSFTDDNVTTLLGANGIYTETNNGSKDVFVVGTKPAGTDWVHTLAGATAATYVDIDESSVDQEVNEDVECAYLRLTAGKTITVKAGHKLTAGEIVIGDVDGAQIIVEAGAKLIITGDKGIVVPAFYAGVDETAKLLIKANATEAGVLLFKPTVGSNKSPWATIEYVSTAKALGGSDYTWDMFANPFATLAKVNSNGVPTLYKHVVNGTWVSFQNKEDMCANAKAFEGIAITNNQQNASVTYEFTGQLQGNISGKVALKPGFNYFGNGFVAKMNAKQVLNAILASGAPVRTFFYTWSPLGGWDTKTINDIDELGDMPAMTMFVLYADGDVEIDLDYTELIWNTNK